MKRPSSRQPQAGMMLIEVLVSILIFSFGILGTVALHARAIQYSGTAEDRGRASLLANEIVSAMWTSGTATLPAAAITAWNTRVGDATATGLPGGAGTVAVDADGVATITVTWQPTFAAAGATNRLVTQVVVPPVAVP
ncbi:MAG: fimbrial assembly protein [Methylibium sp.]|nr:fimbrial assembly protein [Methylibium sp.]